jgi:diadenosine tetraphosphate (Ap4A) HIT family hydrolase
MKSELCPFCERITSGEILIASALSAVIKDAFPINPGHCLIVPNRHVMSIFEMTDDEAKDLFGLVTSVKAIIEKKFSPAGYNLGMNIGPAAGQTIAHAHLHVIPRYQGDVEDPRGGVRYIIPARAKYWEDRG